MEISDNSLQSKEYFPTLCYLLCRIGSQIYSNSFKNSIPKVIFKKPDCVKMDTADTTMPVTNTSPWVSLPTTPQQSASYVQALC